MKKNQIITGLLALTIVLSGCSKGRSYDNGANQTNQTNQTVSSNYQPKGEYQEYDDYEDELEDSNNDSISENTDYKRICEILDSYGYILDGNFDATLSCSDETMDEYANRVLVDLGNLKLAYENGDTDSINTFESNLVDNTKQLQELARNYIISDTFIEKSVPVENQVFLGGKRHDPFFRDIDTVNDALTCFEQLSLRVEKEEVHSYAYAYLGLLTGDESSDDVVFYDLFMTEYGALNNYFDSISSLYNNDFDETLENWSYETIDSDMDSLYDQYYQDNNLLSSSNSNSKTLLRRCS